MSSLQQGLGGRLAQTLVQTLEDAPDQTRVQCLEEQCQFKTPPELGVQSQHHSLEV
jgi:hypothetical protein